MAIPRPSNARIVVRHYEDGKMRVFVDDKPMPGVMNVTIHRDGAGRSELRLTITGLAYRFEQSLERSGAVTVEVDEPPTA